MKAVHLQLKQIHQLNKEMRGESSDAIIGQIPAETNHLLKETNPVL